jgi:hypothetical protein
MKVTMDLKRIWYNQNDSYIRLCLNHNQQMVVKKIIQIFASFCDTGTFSLTANCWWFKQPSQLGAKLFI